MTNHSAQNPLDAHARKSLLLYIPSNNAAKNIINKSFNILDSDPVRSRVEGSPAFSRYPGEPTFLTFNFFGKLVESFLCKTQTWLGWNKKGHPPSRATRFRRYRVTLLPGKYFCHAGIHFASPTRVFLAKCRFTEHARAF